MTYRLEGGLTIPLCEYFTFMKMSAEMGFVDVNSLDGTDIVCSKLGKQYSLRLIICMAHTIDDAWLHQIDSVAPTTISS